MGEQSFATEAELCAAFTRWVTAKNGGAGPQYGPWQVYPETGDFDLLVVDKYGRQLGIEAKLKMNAKVLVQALPASYSAGRGPDWRGILVPAINPDLAELAKLHGLVVFTPMQGTPGTDFTPGLYYTEMVFNAWHDFNPEHRCPLPPLVPDLPAGVPAPVKLTPWKVGALKVLAHLELHGTITAHQVRDCGVDSRRFCSTDGWLESAGGGQWRRGRVPAFDQQHPDAYAMVLARLRAAAQQKEAG